MTDEHETCNGCGRDIDACEEYYEECKLRTLGGRIAELERERDAAIRAMKQMAEHDSDGLEFAHVHILKEKLAIAVEALERCGELIRSDDYKWLDEVLAKVRG